MAERIRYKGFNDEAAVVVTLIAGDAIRGLTDINSFHFATRTPPRPFRALWEAVQFASWALHNRMRANNVSYQADDDLRVAARSIDNLTAALKERYADGRQVLLVLSPMERHLHGNELPLVQTVRKRMQHSGFELLDLHAPVSSSVTSGFY